jgi:hypothetical protein
MKKVISLLFVLSAFHMGASAQTRGTSAQTSHFVSCMVSNMLYFSLESNDKSDVNAIKELIVNSGIPMTISVKETTTEPSFSYVPDLPMAESHGPAISQLLSVKNVHYYTDGNTFYATSLLYTAAAM